MIALLLLIFTILVFQLERGAKTVSREDVTSVKVNSKQIESAIQLKSEVKEAKSFTSSITIPFSKKESIDVAINAWAIGKENDFFDEMEQYSFVIDDEINAHFSIETEVIKVKDDLFSFILTVEQVLDSENQYSEIKTFVVNLKDESFITLNDFLIENTLEDETFRSLLSESIEPSNISQEDFQSNMEHPSQIRWSLEKENMVFYFNYFGNKEDLQMKTSRLTYKQLEDYLAKQYKDIFIPKEEKKEVKKHTSDKMDGKKLVALTFDDGPDSKVTPQILQALKEFDAKATFFMLSQNVKANPEIAKQVVAEGHEAANHSISHANLNTVGVDKIKSEILDSQSVIEEITGVKPALFRPPFGEFNQTVTNIASESGQAITMWSVDTLDWKYRNANTIYDNIITNTNDGSIVLLHDIHQTTADALPNVLSKLKDDGFEFVTVTELLPHISADGAGPYYGK